MAPWISTKTILTSLSLFHLTLAFFFFFNPSSIADQAMVFFLGEAAGLPANTTPYHQPSPPLTFCAALLLLLGLSDLCALSTLGQHDFWLARYWSAQAPLRTLVFAALVSYAWLFSSSDTAVAVAAAADAARDAVRRVVVGSSDYYHHPYYSLFGSGGDNLSSKRHEIFGVPAAGAAAAGPLGAAALGGAEGLRNRVFFAFSVLELFGWVWVWVTLREERSALLATARSIGRGAGGKRRRSSAYGSL